MNEEKEIHDVVRKISHLATENQNKLAGKNDNLKNPPKEGNTEGWTIHQRNNYNNAVMVCSELLVKYNLVNVA